MMYGILGYPLGHSFSKSWFEARGFKFENFEYGSVEEFLEIRPRNLHGFSVTIPHKEAIMPYLDEIDPTAREVGAVNCVKVLEDGSLCGYNTDVIGFGDTILPYIKPAIHHRAAVLGSGGAAKAVVWVLNNAGLEVDVISRGNGGYNNFKSAEYQVIVNTTPLGMFPNVDSAPPIDYQNITEETVCYDLVYNPEETEFMAQCRERAEVVIGGLGMLHSQAEAALRLYEGSCN